MLNLKFLTSLAIVSTLLIPSYGHTAMVASSDQAGGYSNAVLDAVVKKWQPPKTGKASTTRIMIMIDGEGNVEECSVLKNTPTTPEEQAACNAVTSIGKFATPPYGLPMDVFLTFWVSAAEATPAGVPLATAPPASQGTPNSSSAPIITEPPLLTGEDKQTAAMPAVNNSYKPVIQDNRSGAVLDQDDYYVKMVMRKIGPNVAFPPNLPQGELSASLNVQVDGKGNIKSVKTVQSSGISDLDNALVKATQKTGKVNAPPDDQPRELYLTFIIKNN